MIELISDKTANTVGSFKNDTVGMRILSNMNAYGCDRPFALFWRQINDENQVTALLSKMDGTLFLTAADTSDYEELALFISAMKEQNGAVLCPLPCAQRLSISYPQLYHEMVLGNIRGKQNSVANKTRATLSEIYAILKAGEDGDITLPPFEVWYADFSHKIRHGQTRAIVFEHSAVALTSAELTDRAVISGVSVLPHKRGEGLGKAAVLALCGELQKENKAVYVVCSVNMTAFYEKLGFICSGTTTISI